MWHQICVGNSTFLDLILMDEGLSRLPIDIGKLANTCVERAAQEVQGGHIRSITGYGRLKKLYDNVCFVELYS